MERPILEIKNLQTYFYVDGKVLRAVDGLSYSVGRGEDVYKRQGSYHRL